jgi:hypothetical protein
VKSPIKALVCTILAASFFPQLSAQQQQAPEKDVESLRKAALEIDKHIAAFYRRQKLPVPAVTDDATFLRRASLVAIGRIPTAEEALAFLEIEDDSKREELVAYLMQGPGYSSHMSNWAFDLLRIRDKKSQSSFDPYRDWIRQAMKDNMPWDEFVNQLVKSSGNGWNPETAAVGYYTIDRGMPLDNLANTMRIFLGSNMECAQCHDDPFEETERLDFYNLAAFTEGQSPKNIDAFSKVYREFSRDREEDSQSFQVVNFIRNEIYWLSLEGGGDGRIKLPDDYQYRDGKPGEYVGGRTPFGKSLRTSDRKHDGEARKQFAEWITKETGPQFPGVIANRMWERVMGKGIYEPVDQYTEAADTVYPDLMKYVTKLMVDLDYDVRAFQHVLMLTKTFQFVTNPNPSSVEGGDDFHGRKIERLTAEQIWDSLITLADGDPDKKPLKSLDTRVRFGKNSGVAGGMDMIEFSDKILAMESEDEVADFVHSLIDEVKSKGGGKKNRKNSDDSMEMMGGEAGTSYRRDDPVRASELPSPAPRDHLLYVFGASDREVVAGASLESNVGQILGLMNGFVQRQLVNNRGAHLYESLEGASSDGEKIRRLYVAILNRPPSDEEMGWMQEEVKAEGEDGYRNIVSALVMSSEFLFLQ